MKIVIGIDACQSVLCEGQSLMIASKKRMVIVDGRSRESCVAKV